MGDYEMVNMMCREPLQGNNTYAKFVNFYHLMQAGSVAHRNRIDILVDYLKKMGEKASFEKRKFNILTIGCGPALEVQRFISSSSLSENCSITLLDFSQETLEHAKNAINKVIQEAGRNVEVSYVQESVHNLLKQAVKQQDISGKTDSYDYIYCAGLFDYLSDKICSRLMRLFYRWINPGGEVLVTNVHPDNPNKYWLNHVLEWHLIYRDEKNMNFLAPDIGAQKLFADDTGINLFLEVKKK